MEDLYGPPLFITGAWKVSPHFAPSKKHPTFYEIETDDIHHLLVAKTWNAGYARLLAAAPDVRRASQKFYDAVQRYLDEADRELPEELVERMNELETAWNRADGTVPEKN